MARQFLPQIATANHLLDGDAVYFTADGKWSRDFSEAMVAQTRQDADVLLSIASQFPDQVVGAYLADALISPHGIPSPAHYREAFRANGPSNYFHGKQAVMPDRRLVDAAA